MRASASWERRGRSEKPMRGEASHPVTPVSCSDIAELLPAMVDDGVAVAPEMWEHTGTCLRCQAELARYRGLLRSLRALRHEQLRPASATVAATLGAVAAAPESWRSAHAAHLAYVGGVVVATAASAAGMVVWATRRRVALAS
jgi:hypothetical protein